MKNYCSDSFTPDIKLIKENAFEVKLINVRLERRKQDVDPKSWWHGSMAESG